MSKRKIIIVSIFSIFLVALLSGFFFLRSKYVVPILMYHSVNPAAKENLRLVVPPEIFDRQMGFLKKNRYNVIPVESLIKLIKENKKIPPKTLCITFDDGYKDNYLYAFPVLKKYNLPATVFIIVNEIGRGQNDRLSWDEVKKMRDSGIVFFGSHCLGPEPLVNMHSDAQILHEITDSKKALEEKLGVKIPIFSYPEGLFNPKIRQMVIDAGYSGAVATNPGRQFANDDCFALKRLRISRNAGNMFVFYTETSGYYTFFKEGKKLRHEKRKASGKN
ncbi:MAG: polysaccharide deacetylase family protein [Candidatus Omnitrophica bacterium]|nr:polysaccharide deacetylase family protein [Candidatus Omnitrophota bacterium]MDD5652808.1 polysaccharide deacetylase family protein [Candidatus Omnitrophota bacterium]